MKDIGLENGIPSLGGNLSSDPEAQHKISQFITGGLDVAVSSFAAVITDLIVSAISGAIERKELNDHIDALTKFRDKCAAPLLEAAIQVQGIAQAIKDGTYKLSDQFLLTRVL
jgi:hypothetical protein